jgi:phytoene dehydrogenase-like protein
VKIIEASDRAGGRIKTDSVDGFRLDRGFQVLLTSYPEAQMLDKALQLKTFCLAQLSYMMEVNLK